MSGRARRQTRPPKKWDDGGGSDENGDPPRGVERKYVMRLLGEADITRRLLKRELYLLWPDDGVWYPAKVQKVDVAAQRADVIYTTTDEEENINLAEVIADKSIAFREARPASHKLASNEVLDEEERPYAESPPPDSDGEEPEAEAAASAEREASEPMAEDDAEEEAEADMDEDASASEGSDDEELAVARRGGRRSGASEPDSGSEDGGGAAQKKRKRVTKAGEPRGPTGRPRRQIKLSSKAQELLSGERQAQLEAILQGRDVSAEARADVMAALPPEERPGRDDFSSAEAYEKQLMSQLAAGGSGGGGGSGGKAPPPRRSGSLKGQASNTASEAEVREKAVEQIAAALEKVAAETGSGELPEAKGTAEGVEMALYTLYGDAGKDYKAKYRSLIFNLRDPANPDLRRRVLAGEIPPAKLVRLSPNELASKQLSAWREEKEKEAMKAAVLDTQAAAKFSTAAALASKRSGEGAAVDWRDSTLATASPPREGPGARREATPEARDATGGTELPRRPSGSGELQNAAQAAAGSGGTGERGSWELPPTPSLEGRSTAIKAGSSAFDWSSVKASALQEWEARPPEAGQEDGSEPEYQPGEEEPAAAQAAAAGEEDGLVVAETTGKPQQIWHGVLGNACPVPLPVVMEYLAGNPALAAGLPPRQADVKGRVQLDRAADFMRGLKASRSRAISLGLIRLANEATEDDKGQLGELLRQYKAKDRCGVLPMGESEYYLLGSSRLAAGLLAAAGGGVHSLKDVPQLHLLVVAVHRKDLKLQPRSGTKEGKPPRQSRWEAGRGEQQPAPEQGAPPPPPPIVSPSTQPGPASSPAAQPRPPQQGAAPPGLGSQAFGQSGQQGGGGPQPQPQQQQAAQPAQQQPAPQQQPPPQQPPPQQQPLQGIDLSSLGSLAAVLGVSSGLNLGPQQPAGTLPPLVAQPTSHQFPHASQPGGYPPPMAQLQQAPGGYGMPPQGQFAPPPQQQQQQQWGGHSQPMQHPWQQQQPPPQQQQQQQQPFLHHMQQQQRPQQPYGMGGYGQQPPPQQQQQQYGQPPGQPGWRGHR